MLRQIKLLLKLQLVNCFGLNEARHGGNTKARRGRIALLCSMALVVAMACGYAAALCYALARIGAEESIPTLLALVAGLVVLLLTLFRAGPVIFDLDSYERLIALPLRPTAIVASRFLRMYVANAALALVVFLPGTITAVVMLRPGGLYCAMLLLGALVVPLIPMALATLLGALVYGLAARMRRKNMAVVLLTLLMVVALMLASGLLASMDGVDDVRLLNLISDLVDRIGRIYPPAGWFAACVRGGNLGGYLALAAGSLAAFSLLAVGAGARFHEICAALGARAARGGFLLETRRRRSLSTALLLRELRRYGASPVYVVNTIIGGSMSVLLGLGAWIALGRMPELRLMLSATGMVRYAPFLLAMLFAISPCTSCGISLEGKQWWQIKCLPVADGAILRAKLMLHLVLELPCWLLSSALLIGALGATVAEAAALLLVPLTYLLLSGALGLRLNLAMPSFAWESETQPVKQGRAVLVALLAGFAAALVPAVLMYLLPAKLGSFVPALAAICALAGALVLYRSCLRVQLRKIN